MTPTDYANAAMRTPRGIDASRTPVGKAEDVIRALVESVYREGLLAGLNRLERVQALARNGDTVVNLLNLIDAEVEAARKEAGE